MIMRTFKKFEKMGSVIKKTNCYQPAKQKLVYNWNNEEYNQNGLNTLRENY